MEEKPDNVSPTIIHCQSPPMISQDVQDGEVVEHQDWKEMIVNSASIRDVPPSLHLRQCSPGSCTQNTTCNENDLDTSDNSNNENSNRHANPPVFFPKG